MAQLNCNRSKIPLIELINWAKSNSTDILLIPEPPPGLSIIVKNYPLFVSGETSCSPRAAIVQINLRLSASLVKELTSRDVATIRLAAAGRTLHVTSMYLPGDDGFTASLAKIREVLQRTGADGDVLIGGDANAHSAMSGSETSGTRGEEVEDLISQYGLHVINEGRMPTFETVRYGQLVKSIIDVTLCNGDWEVALVYFFQFEVP